MVFNRLIPLYILVFSHMVLSTYWKCDSASLHFFCIHLFSNIGYGIRILLCKIAGYI